MYLLTSTLFAEALVEVDWAMDMKVTPTARQMTKTKRNNSSRNWGFSLALAMV